MKFDDFRFWHETDLPRCPQFGRYRGESGHGGYERRLPSLTPSGPAPTIPMRLFSAPPLGQAFGARLLLVG